MKLKSVSFIDVLVVILYTPCTYVYKLSKHT
jgi:hypothetical protein